MKIFADMHQDDLYYSLWLLFVKRLGGELYRPTGFEWFKNGFWKYNEEMQVVEQYLRTPKEAKDQGGYLEIYEGKHGYNHKALTYDQFLKMDIDIVIASVNQHEVPYAALCQKHPNRPKLIRQIGNVHDNVDTNVCKNLLISAAPRKLPSDVNAINYHQEFELTTFKNVPPTSLNKITNLMNCVPDSVDYPVWKEYKSLLSEYDWKMYGILGEDGIIGTEEGVAKAIRDATFIWHIKRQGDGFGHVIHNAFACGRPPIVKGSYYKNELAGALMEDLVTCIDLDKRSVAQNVEVIRAMSKPEAYARMSKNAYDRFMACVDYDYETEQIKGFLSRLR